MFRISQTGNTRITTKRLWTRFNRSGKSCFPLGERAKSECDWVAMTSVFVVSQSSFFLLRLHEQTLYDMSCVLFSVQNSVRWKNLQCWKKLFIAFIRWASYFHNLLRSFSKHNATSKRTLEWRENDVDISIDGHIYAIFTTILRPFWPRVEFAKAAY